MDKDETMKMLFAEHHRHLSEIKLKIQSLTQRTITILSVATGWIILAKDAPTKNLKIVLILAILSIGISAIYALCRFNKNYREEAKLINKINNYFSLFTEDDIIKNDSVYPEAWKTFGKESVCKGIAHHLITIIVLVALPIAAICIR